MDSTCLMNTSQGLKAAPVSEISFPPPSRRGGGGNPGLKPWLKLVLGLVLVVLFMYVMGPFKEIFPGMGTMSRFVEERDIKATALYYTDIDQFGEATASLRDSRDYSPHK